MLERMYQDMSNFGNPRTHLPSISFDKARSISNQIVLTLLSSNKTKSQKETYFTTSEYGLEQESPEVEVYFSDNTIPNEVYLIAVTERLHFTYQDPQLLLPENITEDLYPEQIDHPDRYTGKDGDLLEGFERYILTKEEMVGAYKFNIIKYTRRCLDKNGIEDLEKAKVYIDRFIQYLKEEEV